jgi:hypothetical protein
MVIFAVLGVLGGGLAVSAASASAGEVPQPVHFSSGGSDQQQFNFDRNRNRDEQFNRDQRDQREVTDQRDRDRNRDRDFCTRSDERLLDQLLFLQQFRHLNRYQRAELRQLEEICGFDFFAPQPVTFDRHGPVRQQY